MNELERTASNTEARSVDDITKALIGLRQKLERIRDKAEEKVYNIWWKKQFVPSDKARDSLTGAEKWRNPNAPTYQQVFNSNYDAIYQNLHNEEFGGRFDKVLDQFATWLNVAGLIPVIGVPANIAAGVIESYRGDPIAVSLSFLAAFPGLAALRAANRAGKLEAVGSKASAALELAKDVKKVDALKGQSLANVAAASELQGSAKLTEAKLLDELKKAMPPGTTTREIEALAADIRNDIQKIKGSRQVAVAEKGLIRLEVINNRTCFVAGTPLMTPTGARAVESFRPGDLILSRSEFDIDGPVETKQVEEVFVRAGPIYELRLGGRSIQTTPEHPFYVRGKGWQAAKELEVGNQLSSHDGRWITLEGIVDLRQVATVYNLRVSDYHTYFVGCKEWGFSAWAHNAEYAILPHPTIPNEFALAERQANGSFVWVTEHNSSTIRSWGSTADARAAIASGGG